MEFQMSWSTYLIVSLIIAAGYYSVFFYRYYHSRLFRVRTTQSTLPKQEASFSSPNHSKVNDHPDGRAQDKLTHLMHDLMDELQALLKQASVQPTSKENLIRCISQLFKKYPLLNSSVFHQPLINLVALETESHCNIHLSADELGSLWE